MDVVKHFRLTHDPFKAGAERELSAGDGAILSAEEARRFIATRTAVAGRSDLFSSAALDLLAAASRGRPAALRLLAGNAMFHAAFDGARRVEELHARQAEATQDIWRDVPPPATPGEPAIAAPPVAVAPIAAMPAPPPQAQPQPQPMPIIAPAAVAAAARASPVIDDDELPPRRRGWWRSAPPLARLAIVVGLLLLSLPVIGYVVGAVKDERPAADSSYPPAVGELAAADAEAPLDTPSELPPVAAPAPVEVAEAGPPIDLTAQTLPPDEPAELPPEDPVATGAGQVQPEPEPAPEEPVLEPAAPAAPRVFVHYSTAQPGAADAAAEVARNLREQGFAVADVRAVPMSIETASVRYFHPGDRQSAEALHDALGEALRPRGYSAGDLKSMAGYDPAPRRGTLEVWVPAG